MKPSTPFNSTPFNYEYRLTDPDHVQRITQIARKQTRGSNVDWQDAFQAAQLKLVITIRAGKFSYGDEQDFDRWATTVARFEIIDLVRKGQRQAWDSIDQLSQNELSLLDTIRDNSRSALTLLEAADLISRVRAAIVNLDRLYPSRCYYRLWLGKVNEKKQTEIAQEMGLSQGTISKRWQELLIRLAGELDLDANPQNTRARSQQKW
jgi:RNA polymerase sigma factor (sigma-70 family)